MTVDKYVELNYEHLCQSARNITKNDPLWMDLLHEMILAFKEKDNAQEVVNCGGATQYLVRMLLNQFNSNTSPFYHNYRNHRYVNMEFAKEVPEDEDDYIKEIAEIANRELDKLDWYEKKLFKAFVNEYHTVSSLSRATRIPRSSITLTLKKVRTHLKKKI